MDRGRGRGEGEEEMAPVLTISVLSVLSYFNKYFDQLYSLLRIYQTNMNMKISQRRRKIYQTRGFLPIIFYLF